MAALPGLAAELEVLLQHLDEGGLDSDESAMKALHLAATIRDSASVWLQVDHSAQEEEALRTIINGVASRFAPVLASLRQQASLLDANSADDRDTLSCLSLVHIAHDPIVACMYVAPACGASSEARLQLARLAIGSLMSCGRLGLSAASLWVRRDPGSVARSCSLQLRMQLELATLCMRVPGFTAASAAEAAPPGEFVAWLLAAVDLLQCLGEASETVLWHRDVLPAFVAACHTLSFAAPWGAHAAATLAQPLLAQTLVQVCLSFLSVLAASLPLPRERRPGECTWQSASQVATMLVGGGWLLVPLKSYLPIANAAGITGAVTAAAQLAQQLPRDQPPPDVSEEQHGEILNSVTALLGMLCSLCDRLAVTQRLDNQQQQKVMRQLLPLISGLPQHMQVVSRGRPVAELGEGPQVLLRAQLLGAYSHIGWLRTFWQGGPSKQRSAAAAWSLSDTAAWYAAACGALQCIPLAQQLHTCWQWEPSPGKLALPAVNMAGCAANVLIWAVKLPSSRAALAMNGSLCDMAWQLHSRLAQLMHFCAAAADGPPVQLSNMLQAGQLLNALSDSITAALDLHSLQAPQGYAASQHAKRQRTMYAAHAAALLACGSQAPLAQLSGSAAQRMLLEVAFSVEFAPAAIGLDPALHRLFQLCSREASKETWWCMIGHEQREQGQRLAALLASGSYLDQMLLTGGQELLEDVRKVLRTLQSAAAGAVATASESAAVSDSSNSALAAGDPAMLDQLRKSLAAFDAATISLRKLPIARLRRDALPPARQLAAALLDWWRRPSAQQEQQLAQAAAARSCAYLGCANLGGSGGPAAGQGEGSMRCSACRAVWYCGTACSHADWRAGHRRMCKLLGAARAAEKAARRQAAEEAGAAAQQEG